MAEGVLEKKENVVSFFPSPPQCFQLHTLGLYDKRLNMGQIKVDAPEKNGKHQVKAPFSEKHESYRSIPFQSAQMFILNPQSNFHERLKPIVKFRIPIY